MSFENHNFPIPPQDDPHPLYKKLRRALYIYLVIYLAVPLLVMYQHIFWPTWVTTLYTFVAGAPLVFGMSGLKSRDLSWLVAIVGIYAVIGVLLRYFHQIG